MKYVEYAVIRSGNGIAIKPDMLSDHAKTVRGVGSPQTLLVPDNMEDLAGYLVELLVGLGVGLYEQHVASIIRSEEPLNNRKYRIKMYHKQCVDKGLI